VSWEVARIDELLSEGAAHLRRHLGIKAFGVNAWSVREDGETIIQEHDELSGGDEELYVVMSGTAVFDLDGETVHATAGSVIHVSPEVRRKATGSTGTTILAVGATPGRAYVATGWEIGASALPRFAAGEYADAREILQRGLEEYPSSGLMLYNLACAEAQLGERGAALEHLARAAELEERFAEYAQTDDDLASLRDDPAFPKAPS
jgi:tetratricopeptide (TPR) repeat protein